MTAINFELNLKAVTVNTEPDMPLLWVLRDQFGLTGTKYGCGAGLCGCCTVHIDGEAVRSCMVPAQNAAGRRVVTIEHLGADLTHPVVQAWLTQNVAQCGYCQSGQIMTAAALLAHHPQPTDEDVDLAMTGVLCRCGTYPRIRSAIHLAAQLQQSPARR
ncbi:MAG TPA: (2Fe-2S)-binding protein [Steroidobacteraceae bacterium]|nr:(2Fe-2S)-binding protein [Steroidobacteraceae bacterium]